MRGEPTRCLRPRAGLPGSGCPGLGHFREPRLQGALNLPQDGDRPCPLLVTAQALGSITLYAGRPAAFSSRQAELTELLERWVPEAAATADLSARTQWRSIDTFVALHEEGVLGRAVAQLQLRAGLDPREAAECITMAAARAGITAGRLARALIERCAS